MKREFSREEFYDLIWSKPIKDLAPKFGMSDVALGKICRQLGFATPGRGYWAKLKGRSEAPPKPQLRPRGFGEEDTVTIGHPWVVRRSAIEVLDDIPPAPHFSESLEDLSARARESVGRVTVPKNLSKAHRSIIELLRADEVRRNKAAEMPYTWRNVEFFSPPFERRRLRIIDAIFRGVEKVGLHGSMRGKNPSELDIAAPNGVHLTFKLDGPTNNVRHSFEAASAADRPASDKLRLEVDWHLAAVPGLRLIWEDSGDYQIEQEISEIVSGLVIAIEMYLRTWKIERHKLSIEHRERCLLEEKAAREAATKEEKKRIERSRQAQLDKLFSDAAAYRLAKDLREYVTEVLSANESDEQPVAAKDIQAWAAWAREQADSIDPVKSRAFLAKAREPGTTDGAGTKDQRPQDAHRPQPESSYQPEAWHPNKWYTKLHKT